MLGTAAVIATNNRRDAYQPRSASQGYDRYANDAGVYANDPAAYGGQAYDDEAYGDRAYGDGAYDDRDQDRAAYDDDQRAAADPVDDCARAAERQAQNGGGFARVTGIDRVDRIEGGANVRGRLQVENGRANPARALNFSCTASFGEVRNLRLG